MLMSAHDVEETDRATKTVRVRQSSTCAERDQVLTNRATPEPGADLQE